MRDTRVCLNYEKPNMEFGEAEAPFFILSTHNAYLPLPYLTNHRLLKEYIPFFIHCISIFHLHLNYYK
jgi:hypothetical protein